MKALFFDTETIGLPERRKGWNKYYPITQLHHYDNCRLIEIGWACDYTITVPPQPDQFTFMYKSFLVKPEGFVTETGGGFKYHKISTTEALKNGYTLKECLKMFMNRVKEVDVIVAHNVLFDWYVIATELLRCNLLEDLEVWKKVKTFCTMQAGANEMGVKSIKLETLYQNTFNSSTPYEQHRATGDIKCLVDIYRKRYIHNTHYVIASKMCKKAES